MKKLLINSLLLLVTMAGMAQQNFLFNGVIEYERHINVHRQFENENNDNEFWKEFISKQPKFNNSYFTLSFNKEQAVYQPGREGTRYRNPG
ncbi:MAG: hypothetical protein QM664_14650 [Flavihumibacter sp.]